MGRTLGKSSRTGREVIEKMRKQGEIKVSAGETFFWSRGKKKWFPLKDADMAHIDDAVTWWNKEGRKYGAKSKEVRNWMLNSENYYLEHFSVNRSEGAKLGKTYLDPLK